MKRSVAIRLTLLLILIFGLPACYADESLRIQRASPNSTPTATPSTEPTNGNFQVRLALPDKAPARDNTTKLQANVSEDAADENGLTQLDLQRLAAHDIVLLVDKSGSMDTPDCPSKSGGASKIESFLVPLLVTGSLSASRWNWCHTETEKMVRQTESVLPEGFSVVLFDSRFSILPHVTVDGLANLFRNNHPSGGTDLAAPLDCVFRDYFTRKRLPGSSIKPLLIGVITDGCPNFPRQVHDVIIKATHSISNPSEITIVFFLIGGQDRMGEDFVRDITHNLTREGASSNIVKSVSFHDLKKVGLAKALAENL